MKSENFAIIMMIIAAGLISVIGLQEIIEGYIGGIVFFLAGAILIILILNENIKRKMEESKNGTRN